jgi:hypothetical protein
MNGNDNTPEPSPSYKVVTKDVGGNVFTAGFYPGFARSIALNDTNVYDQKADGPYPFNLPLDNPVPWSSSAVVLSSSKGYRVVMCLDDPDHVIDQIVLRLRDPKSEEALARGVVAFQAAGDVVVIDNTPVLCPPMCGV